MKIKRHLFTYLAGIFSVAMMVNSRAYSASPQPIDGYCAEKPELPGRTEHGKIVQQWADDFCGSQKESAQCTDLKRKTNHQCEWINNKCAPIDCNRVTTKANCLIPGVPARCEWKQHTGQIRAENLCLTANNSKVTSEICQNNEYPAQQWSRDGYSLKNSDDSCLAVKQPDFDQFKDGAELITAKCDGSASQQFMFEERAKGSKIRSKNTKCLNIDDNSFIRKKSGKAQLWDCNGKAHQELIFTFK